MTKQLQSDCCLGLLRLFQSSQTYGMAAKIKHVSSMSSMDVEVWVEDILTALGSAPPWRPLEVRSGGR